MAATSCAHPRDAVGVGLPYSTLFLTNLANPVIAYIVALCLQVACDVALLQLAVAE